MDIHLEDIQKKCDFSLIPFLQMIQQRDLRVMCNGRDLVIKFSSNREDLAEATLLVITQDGEVEIVPKWIIPALEKIIPENGWIEAQFTTFIQELMPYKFHHPRYPYSLYFKIRNCEEKLANALHHFANIVESKVPKKTPN